MSIARIASRYAKPVLELAEEKGILEQVKGDMAVFQQICKSNPDFLSMLKSPVISHLKKDQILKAIFTGKVTELTLTALSLITRKNREFYLPYVADEFMKLYNKKMGLVPATVVTSFPISKTLRADFEKTVQSISNKKPLLEEKAIRRGYNTIR